MKRKKISMHPSEIEEKAWNTLAVDYELDPDQLHNFIDMYFDTNDLYGSAIKAKIRAWELPYIMREPVITSAINARSKLLEELFQPISEETIKAMALSQAKTFTNIAQLFEGTGAKKAAEYLYEAMNRVILEAKPTPK